MYFTPGSVRVAGALTGHSPRTFSQRETELCRRCGIAFQYRPDLRRRVVVRLGSQSQRACSSLLLLIERLNVQRSYVNLVLTETFCQPRGIAAPPRPIERVGYDLDHDDGLLLLSSIGRGPQARRRRPQIRRQPSKPSASSRRVSPRAAMASGIPAASENSSARAAGSEPWRTPGRLTTASRSLGLRAGGPFGAAPDRPCLFFLVFLRVVLVVFLAVVVAFILRLRGISGRLVDATLRKP